MLKLARFAFLLGLLWSLSHGQSSLALTQSDPLIRFVGGQTSLTPAQRGAYETAVKRRFGGAALDPDDAKHPEIGAAKAVLTASFFTKASPKEAVDAAWEAYRSVLGYVPTPIAVHYWSLALEGKKPKGRPIDLAFDFPNYYNEEIAPDLVHYWETGLKTKQIPKHMRRETRAALRATRRLMRPLLIDKLRLLAQLERSRESSAGEDREVLERDIRELNQELRDAFSGVVSKKSSLNPKRSAYRRLLTELKAAKLSPTEADLALAPKAKPEAKPEVQVQEKAMKRLSPAERRRQRRIARIKAERARREAKRKARIAKQKARREAKARRKAKIAESRRKAKARREAKAKTPESRVGAESQGASASRDRLMSAIRPWLGTPYAWGRSECRLGTDCSGFTQSIFQSVYGIRLPRTSRDQARMGKRVAKSELKVGDLVFFDSSGRGRINHVGIVTGPGRFAHASTSRGVRYDKLASKYYRRTYRGARRLLP